MIGRLFWKREDGLPGRWLSWLVSFFTIITPIFYILNLLKLEINYYSAIGILITIWLGTGLISKKKLLEFGKQKIKAIFFWLLAYLALHLIFYSIYFTIPEWDSYGNISSVRDNLVSGFIVSSYRPLFSASMTIFSLVSSVDPYILFPIVLIVAQSSLLFSVYLFTKDNKDKFLRGLILVSTLAVPVINMEIDIPRAQSVLMVFIPIFFYYLKVYFSEKKDFRYLIVVFWISIVGLMYHELFAVLVLVAFCSAAKIIIKLWINGGKKDKIIITLICFVTFLLGWIAYDHLFTISYAFGLANNVINNLIHNFSWKWWFLSTDLSADNMSVAWIGWKSIAMYYGYYLSPIIFGWIILHIFSIFIHRKLSKIHIWLLFTGILYFALTEILPRMNIGILPERSWIFFDIIVLLFTASFLKNIKHSYLIKAFIVFLIIVSMYGSFVVAMGKKSLTSSEEMKAAVWIKNNTPKESIFLSQQANNQIVRFFGERNMLSPNKEFFLSEKLIEQSEVNICESDIISTEINKTKNLLLNFDILNGNTNNLAVFVNETREKIKKFKTICYPVVTFSHSPLYVMYSSVKLEGLYSTREWWREVNYYGAKLDKFDIYPLVYDYGGVKIWRLR
ncbi:MAG: hypothetical protein WA052_02775 [Microgenomates group bacterium]